MADYVRFEVYLPVVFRSKKDDKRYALDPSLVEEFVGEVTGTFSGLTQANPNAAPLFKGWWRSAAAGDPPLVNDFLTYLFGLIAIDEMDKASAFFTLWKSRFESDLEQDIVLVIYYPVKVLGGFL